MDANQIYQSERETIERLRAQFPEKFVPKKRQDGELLEYVHAKGAGDALPKAFLKYSPFDFIVEEIGSDGKVVRVDQSESSDVIRDEATTGTVYADLIKIGISTVEAVYQLQRALGSKDGQIQYGGIKDAGSLTSQKISFRGIPADRVREVNLPNLFLTNIREGKGAMTVGGIDGNLFTIYLRTEHDILQDGFTKKAARSQLEGVPNYYGTQRFGAPRFLSHVFGKYLCQGDPEGLLKSIFFETTDFEWPYVADIRNRARELWGNWDAIAALFSELPHTFRMELKFLGSLRANPAEGIDAYRTALMTVPDQLDFWVKAYGSFYTNAILLDAHETGKRLPEKIPLLASRHPDVMLWYRSFLEADGTLDYLGSVRQFPSITISPRAELDARVYPTWHGIKAVPGGVIVSFELPKGAYATTILNDFFEIVSGAAPEWVTTELVDAKQTLGTGSTQHLFERFQDVLPKHLLGT